MILEKGLLIGMTNVPNDRASNPAHQAGVELTTQAKVYAARMRLQDSLDQADALEAIREIVANLMGSEELAIYKVDQEKAALWLYWSFGIDPNKYAVLDVIREPHLESVLERRIVIRGDHGNEKLLSTGDTVTALVPIFVSGETAAVLVIFRLLPQKPAFEAADRQICEVLSHCAGRAIEPYRT